MLQLFSFGSRAWGTGVLFSIVVLVIYKIFSIKLSKKRYLDECARRGTAQAPTLRSTNLLGTSVLKESMKATKEDRGPQYVVSAMNKVGKDVHTLRVPVFNYELLVTRDPENVRAMFSSQSSDYDISRRRANAFMPLLGEGIFTSTGAQWKHSRALVRPQFSREEISNLDLVDTHVQIMHRVLFTLENGWTDTVDLQPLFFNFTLDIATEFLYGQSVHSQSAMAKLESDSSSGIDGAAFSHHFGVAKHLVDKRGAMGKFAWLMPMKEMKMHCTEIHKVIDKMISQRLADNAQKEKTFENGRKFVLLDELAKETQNLRELRNETLHTLMAGRDPTGALLGWVFYFLARNPEMYSKLRQIILAQFSKNIHSEIDFAQLRKCEYLQWVLHEAIRIVAIIPMNERVALHDTTLPRGGGEDGSKPIFVRKGIQILIPLYAIQHRPDIWGEDAEEFRPERWDGRKIGWEWIPFGGGARKCLGQQFALTEASYLMVRFLQRFDKCENMEGPGEIKLHVAIETRSGTGVNVRFHEAAQ